MKTPDGYRFSLQFAANSTEYIRAGETLERLKHKKSDFIVKAVCEYLERHPEIEAGAVVQIDVRRELFRRDELEKICNYCGTDCATRGTPQGRARHTATKRGHCGQHDA